MPDPNTLDLKKLGGTVDDADAGAFCHLRHPETDKPLFTGGDDPQPVGLTLCGQDGKRFQAAFRKMLDRRSRKGAKNISAEDAADEAAVLLAAVTIGFRNIRFGEIDAYSPENAKLLYLAAPWIREQADQFIGHRPNFLKASPES